jgi:TP901 family phage tail tape measure protein
MAGDVSIQIDLISRQAQANAEAMSDSLKDLWVQEKALEIAGNLLRDSVALLGQAMLTSAKNSIEFESSLASIKTILPTAEINKLRKELLDLSSAFGFDELSTAKAQYDLLSSGITDAADASLVLKNSAELATAGMDSLDSASKTVAVAINAFGLSAKDSAHITDVLAQTTQFGVLTLNELGGAFSQVAPIAAGAGISIEETSAALAAITLSGKPASEAATGIKAALSALLKPSEDLEKAFRKVSSESLASSIATKGLDGTLQLVRKAIGDGSDAWIKYLGGTEAATAGIVLATGKQKEFAQFTKDMSDKTREAGSVVKEMGNTVKETAKFQIGALTQSFENLGTEIASTFEPAIAEAAKTLTGFVIEIKAFVRENEEGLRKIGEEAVKMVQKFGEFVKAIAASNDLKNSIYSLYETAKVMFKGFEDGFGIINKLVSSDNEGFKGFVKILEDARPLLQTVAGLFGTLASVGVELFIKFTPLRKLFELLVDGLTATQKALFGWTGVYKETNEAIKEQKLAMEELPPLFAQQSVAIKQSTDAQNLLNNAAKEFLDTQKETAKEVAKPKIVPKLGPTKEELKALEERKKEMERYRKEQQQADYEAFKAQQDAEAFNNEQLLKLQEEFIKEREQLKKEQEQADYEAFKSEQEAEAFNNEQILKLEDEKLKELKKKREDDIKSVEEWYKNTTNIIKGAVSTLSTITSAFKGTEPVTVEAQIEALPVDEVDPIQAIEDERDAKIAAIKDISKEQKDLIEDEYKKRIDEEKKLQKQREKQAKIDAITAKNNAAIAKAAAENEKARADADKKKLEAAGKVVGAIGDQISKIPGIVGQVGGLIAGVVSIVYQLPEIIRGLPNMIKGMTDSIPILVKELGNAIAEVIPPLLQEGMKRSFDVKYWMEFFGNFFGAMGNIVKSVFDGIGEEINFKSWGGKIWDGLKNAADSAGDWIAGIGKKIWDGLSSLAETIWAWFKDIGSKIWNGLKEAVGDIVVTFGEWGASIWNGFVSAVKDIAAWFAEKGMMIWNGLKDAVSGAWETLKGWGSTIANGLWDGIKELGNWLYDAGKRIWEGLKSVFSFDFFSGGGGVNPNRPGEVNVGQPGGGNIFAGRAHGGMIGAANGWWVPGAASVSGDSFRNDTVPAMLSPGELVVPRSAVQDGLAGIMRFAAQTLGSRSISQVSGMAVGGIARSADSSMSNSELLTELLTELRNLRAEVATLGYALAKTGVQTYQILDRWENGGLPSDRGF